jgi:dihydroneopterin aldolase
MREDSKRLTDMVFHGCHGTLQAEHELGQPFVVSLELRLDLRPAGTSDDLTESVDYGKVHYMARVIVEGSPVQLTETLAERIAAATLDEHPEVEHTRQLCRRDVASSGSQTVGYPDSGSRTAPAAHTY